MGRVTHYDTVQMLTRLLARRENVAKYYVTVTAGQTHTISVLAVSAATVMSWGDGLTDTYTGRAMRTHVYASAGTYEVDIYTPENVTEFSSGAYISSLNTADFAGMINMKTFELVGVPNVTFDTTVLPDWTLNRLVLNNIMSGAAGVIRSEDMAKWGITQIYFGAIGPGVTGSIETACFASNDMSLLSNLANTIPSVVSENSIRNWPKLGTLAFNKMTTQDVDLILLEAYQINRTVTGGKIDLLYGNATPSGTFQACQSCPVTASTPGKEIAYELLNDSCGKGFNKWATVSTN